MKTAEYRKAKRLRSGFNMMLSLFWTMLNGIPVLYFSYVYIPLRLTIWVLIGASITYFLPHRWLDRMRISASDRIYKMLGIKTVRKLTQDGDWVNRYIKIRYPNASSTPKRQKFRHLRQKFYFLEKFHLHLMVYFLFASGYAVYLEKYLWAVVVLFCNVLYNIYPVLLQQYNRIRLRRL